MNRAVSGLVSQADAQVGETFGAIAHSPDIGIHLSEPVLAFGTQQKVLLQSPQVASSESAQGILFEPVLFRVLLRRFRRSSH
jgi:hypothetical protein